MNEELMQELEEVNRESADLDEKLKIVDQQLNELKGFLAALEEIGNNKEKEILASLGKGVYIKSSLSDEKLFVEVGSGVLVRKSIPETKEIVEQQTKRLNMIRTQLASENAEINSRMQKLLEDIETK